MSTITIQPQSFGKTAIAIEVRVQGFELYSKTGRAMVIFKDDKGGEIERKSVDLPESLFTAWGTDDSVVENYVCQQLGLTKA